MKLHDAVVLITGANRGIGRAFAEAAVARGARRVYAGARDPSSISIAGAEPIKLDVTSAKDVSDAAAACQDVTLVVNNAGIARPGGLLGGGATESTREHLETNLFGVLSMMLSFSPILAQNGGGAFLNVLSVASWINTGNLTAYGISKSAAWSLTNGLRNELRKQNTQVLGLHVGWVDTDMTKAFDVAKLSPRSVVDSAFDALEAGASEVLAGERAQQIKRDLTADPPVYL
ncbi:MAG: SDR family oxidoreductase [Burkholderiaceae bacterium]|jgi:NAD(P)-dependent dehydrogenase (short-subunit alcohol dehydrogenase family)